MKFRSSIVALIFHSVSYYSVVPDGAVCVGVCKINFLVVIDGPFSIISQ